MPLTLWYAKSSVVVVVAWRDTMVLHSNHCVVLAFQSVSSLFGFDIQIVNVGAASRAEERLLRRSRCSIVLFIVSALLVRAHDCVKHFQIFNSRSATGVKLFPM
jgi:hypothetical protein